MGYRGQPYRQLTSTFLPASTNPASDRAEGRDLISTSTEIVTIAFAITNGLRVVAYLPVQPGGELSISIPDGLDAGRVQALDLGRQLSHLLPR